MKPTFGLFLCALLLPLILSAPVDPNDPGSPSDTRDPGSPDARSVYNPPAPFTPAPLTPPLAAMGFSAPWGYHPLYAPYSPYGLVNPVVQQHPAFNPYGLPAYNPYLAGIQRLRAQPGFDRTVEGMVQRERAQVALGTRAHVQAKAHDGVHAKARTEAHSMAHTEAHSKAHTEAHVSLAGRAELAAHGDDGDRVSVVPRLLNADGTPVAEDDEEQRVRPVEGEGETHEEDAGAEGEGSLQGGDSATEMARKLNSEALALARTEDILQATERKLDAAEARAKAAEAKVELAGNLEQRTKLLDEEKEALETEEKDEQAREEAEQHREVNHVADTDEASDGETEAVLDLKEHVLRSKEAVIAKQAASNSGVLEAQELTEEMNHEAQKVIKEEKAELAAEEDQEEMREEAEKNREEGGAVEAEASAKARAQESKEDGVPDKAEEPVAVTAANPNADSAKIDDIKVTPKAEEPGVISEADQEAQVKEANKQ